MVGWAAVAPRSELPFERSTKIPHVDDLPVWSVWCIRVRPGYRGKGIGFALLRGAVDYAASIGAPAVEGYPVDNKGQKVDLTMAFVGTRSLFEEVGFTKAAAISTPSQWASSWGLHAPQPHLSPREQPRRRASLLLSCLSETPTNRVTPLHVAVRGQRQRCPAAWQFDKDSKGSSDGLTVTVGNQGRPCRTTIKSPSASPSGVNSAVAVPQHGQSEKAFCRL